MADANEILEEFCGYSDDEINTFIKKEKKNEIRIWIIQAYA